MDLTAVVDRLYGAAPEEFVTARKQLAAQARQEGDRMLATRVLALRKPTLPAWAINATVRSEGSVLGQFVEFAEAMREAQSALDGPAMRELSRERESRLNAVAQAVATAAQESGQRLTAPVLAEVRATFVAAIADPAAQEAVLSGCLTRALAYAGLGEVDLTQATAGPGRPRPQQVPEQVTADGEPAVAARPAPGATTDSTAGVTAGSTTTAPAGPAPVQGTVSDESTARETGSGKGPTREPEPDARARRDAEQRAAARRRLLDRSRDRLAEAEREVTARSLAQAQAHEQALRATARAAELERLLRRATQEADTAREAQRAADAALSDATTAREDARAELAALED